MAKKVLTSLFLDKFPCFQTVLVLQLTRIFRHDLLLMHPSGLALNLKSQLDDQTFLSNIVLEEHVLLFSHLSQLCI